MRCRIEREITHCEHVRSIAGVFPCHDPYPCKKLLKCKRFYKVVLRTRIQSGDSVGNTVLCGEKYHRSVIARGSDPLQRIDTAELRHHYIHYDRIEFTHAHVMHGLLAVKAAVNAVALFFEAFCYYSV